MANRADLRTRIRELADQESTQRVTDTILNAWIAFAHEELYDLVIGVFKDHFWTTVDFTLTGGTPASSFFTSTSGIKHIRMLEKNPGTTQRIEITQWELGEKDLLDKIAYRWVGSQIMVEPYEWAGGSYRLYFIPGVTVISDDSTAFDGRIEQWLDFIVYRGAIKCKIRDEEDTSDLRADLASISARIVKLASSRNAAHPPRCIDVTPMWDVPGSSGGGGGGS